MKNAIQAVDIEYLLEHLPAYYTDFDRKNVLRAYEIAADAHAEQKRASGEPYITHCVAVANILAEMRLQPDVIIAGLLHDTVEDTSLTLDDLRREFGEKVAQLVDGVTKLDSLPRVSRSDGAETEEPESPLTEAQRSRHKEKLADETIRKTMLAMNDDVRVIFIKLADRLHNMRTLGYTRPDKQKRIAKETLEIYAKLANRLGIGQIKWELEDLAFRYVNPEKYKEIADQLAERRPTREKQVDEIVARIQTMLNESGIQADVCGRPKHIYSIYRKMEAKQKTFENLRDIRGVRLLVPDIPACYVALGIIHTHWTPISGEFDDYIAAPKGNMYRSLHTAVIYDDKKPLEVQIRTYEMHQEAEYGIAAHWRYKEGSSRDEAYEKHLAQLRATVQELKEESPNAQDFMEKMKSDVFNERIYVFSPKGDIFDLPLGSTPLDFAYHVHTDIGHHCRSAKVEGKLVPLDHTLKTGDHVQILTSKQGGPSRDWLNPSLGMVKTQRARAKIRAWFKKQDREQNLTQGRAMLEKEFHRLGLSEVNLENLARQMEFRTPDDLFVALGGADINISRIINLLGEDNLQSSDIIVTNRPSGDTQTESGIYVHGLRGMASQLAKCCHPAPGDLTIGYVTRGFGVTVHRRDCPNILRLSLTEKDRLIVTSWGKEDKRYPVPIVIYAFDRQGLMSDISKLMDNESINITSANVQVDQERRNADIACLRLTIEVRNTEQLARVLTRVSNLPNVLDARRLREN